MNKQSKKIDLKRRSINRQIAQRNRIIKKQNKLSEESIAMKITRYLKRTKMSWYNVWKWPSELIEDVQQWLAVRAALKEETTQQILNRFKYELRADTIGRLYTVINVPEELYPYEKRDMVWPWMLEQLRELDDLLMECRLNDMVYPEVTQIEGAPAYLVILSPQTESFSIWKFLRWLFNLGIVSLTVYLLNRIAIKAFGLGLIDSIISLF